MTETNEDGSVTAEEAPRSVVAAVRWVYLGRRTGVLEVQQEEGLRRLFFRNGELYLPSAHPLGVLIRPRLERARQSPGGAGRDEDLVRLVERIAETVATWEGGETSFQPGPGSLPQGLLGPIPSSLMVMTQAVTGLATDELMDRLGGQGARFKAVRTDPEILQMAALSPVDYSLLQTVVSPVSVEQLVREEGEEVVVRLARLEAAALVERLPSAKPKADSGVVRVDVIGRIQERIGRQLEERPVTLEPQEHRERLADLLARLGQMDHYQLLKVPREADTDRIHDAFQKLAREVHPSHAERLGLPGREGALEVLFERAAEAYLTLSERSRRSAYDRGLGGRRERPPDEDRSEEQERLAREYYLRARTMVQHEDLGGVVDLLKEAVRRDPNPEYFALMGRVQARNPNWLHQAVNSLEQARRHGNDEPEVILLLAELYEKTERDEQALRLFRRALEADPNDERALDGLSRLEKRVEGRQPWWQRLLGK